MTPATASGRGLRVGARSLPRFVETGHDAGDDPAKALPAVVFDEKWFGLHAQQHGAPDVQEPENFSQTAEREFTSD